jgi:hypothetical protein
MVTLRAVLRRVPSEASTDFDIVVIGAAVAADGYRELALA